MQASPQVVVSITPFYGLVAAIMQGIGTPQILVKPGTSPHEYTLRPSELRMLQNADLIFWGGPALESFMVKPLATLSHEHTVIRFVDIPHLKRLSVRQSEHFEHAHTHCTHATLDMHFWLDPHNAILIAKQIVNALCTLDPKHATQYHENAIHLEKRLIEFDKRIAKRLSLLKKIPYVVFHDAYQYLEHRYGLNAVGALALHPEIPFSAQKLQKIRIQIQKTRAKCVFQEPQFQPTVARNIAQDLNIQLGELDPIGTGSDNCPEGYFQLLERLVVSLENCLKP
jgi:zinc transport system substrate-binding protein